MTAAEAQVLHNVYERQLNRLAADRLALLGDIVALAQAVVEAIPPARSES
jgi:hypothetical protein